MAPRDVRGCLHCCPNRCGFSRLGFPVRGLGRWTPQNALLLVLAASRLESELGAERLGGADGLAEAVFSTP